MTPLACDTLTARQPDSLCVPELLARPDSDRTIVLPQVGHMGYFQDNPLLHPEVTGHRVGIAVSPLEGRLWRGDWVTSLVLVALVMLLLVLRRSGRQLLTQARVFLFTPHGHNTTVDAETDIDRPTTLFFSLLLSLMAAFAAVWLLEELRPAHPALRWPYALIGLFTAGGLLCLGLRFQLYRFVNWVFFGKEKSFTWKHSCLFLISLESLLVFPAVMVAIYFSFPPQHVIWMLSGIVVFVKFLLFLKARQIFFGNFYGLFHLIVYLCTLEAAPLLVVVNILVKVTEKFDVIF